MTTIKEELTRKATAARELHEASVQLLVAVEEYTRVCDHVGPELALGPAMERFRAALAGAELVRSADLLETIIAELGAAGAMEA